MSSTAAAMFAASPSLSLRLVVLLFMSTLFLGLAETQQSPRRKFKHNSMPNFFPQGMTTTYPMPLSTMLHESPAWKAFEIQHRSLQVPGDSVPPRAVDVIIRSQAGNFQELVSHFYHAVDKACKGIEIFNVQLDTVLDTIQEVLEFIINGTELLEGQVKSFCEDPNSYKVLIPEEFEFADYEILLSTIIGHVDELTSSFTTSSPSVSGSPTSAPDSRRLWELDNIGNATNADERRRQLFLATAWCTVAGCGDDDGIFGVAKRGFQTIIDTFDDVKDKFNPSKIQQFLFEKFQDTIVGIVDTACGVVEDPVKKIAGIAIESFHTVIEFIEELRQRKDEFAASLCNRTVGSGSIISRVEAFNDNTTELAEIVEGRQVYLGKEFCDRATLTYDFIKLFRPFLQYFDGIFEFFGLYAPPECAGTTVADGAAATVTGGIPVVEACAAFSTILQTAAGAARYVFVGVISPTLDLFMATEELIVEPLCSCRVLPGSFSAKSGCDKEDNNCDRIIDDCEEDHTKPTITLDPLMVPSTPFTSEQDALNFLTEHVKVSDDCAKNLTKNISLAKMDGIDAYFQVNATDQRCASKTENATQEIVIPLKIDAVPPSVSCGFFLPQDPSFAGGWERNLREKHQQLRYPFPDELLVIDRTNFEGPLADMGFWYSIEDNSQSKLQVQVEVLTNERVGDFSDITTLYLEQTSTGDYDPIHTAGVILELQTCSDPPSNNNGVKSPLCMAERGVENRFYDIVVSARDRAGNSASATCSVVVLPFNDFNISTESSRRFLAANLDFEYDLANPGAGKGPVAPAEIRFPVSYGGKPK